MVIIEGKKIPRLLASRGNTEAHIKIIAQLKVPMQLLDEITYEYTDTKIKILLQGLSSERLTRYSELAGGDAAKQLQIYAWNTALSESLYTSIQGLEIITRNAFNETLTACYGEQWYENSEIKFAFPQAHSIIQAKESLQKEKKLINLNNLVAILSFGFWTGLLGSKYENQLWRRCLYRAFVNKPKPYLRKDMHREFDLIRLLRNRIAHHEPILRADLPNHHERILKMIVWFCEETSDWIKSQSRFDKVWTLSINPYL